MSTRKLFRMGYEPCKGDCYMGKVFPITDFSPEEREEIERKLLAIHDPTCGNANVRFGVDLDEARGTFVGVFYHYGAMETVLSESLKGALDGLLDLAVEHFASDQWREELAQDPGLGRDACAYGTNDSLLAFVRRTGRSLDEALRGSC